MRPESTPKGVTAPSKTGAVMGQLLRTIQHGSAARDTKAPAGRSKYAATALAGCASFLEMRRQRACDGTQTSRSVSLRRAVFFTSCICGSIRREIAVFSLGLVGCLADWLTWRLTGRRTRSGYGRLGDAKCVVFLESIICSAVC
jgi:hypothetical protein